MGKLEKIIAGGLICLGSLIPMKTNANAWFADTQYATSQSENWNGILIWDQEEGLVGWKNGFGNVTMPYELTPNSWKWINHYDFNEGCWTDQTVNFRNRIVESEVSVSPGRSGVGTEQGYDIESDTFHYACVADMETGFNDVQFGSGDWTVRVPKSDTFQSVSIYSPTEETWSDVIYHK